jgi:hypothetical protein
LLYVRSGRRRDPVFEFLRFDKVQGCVADRSPSATCASKLADELCGQVFESIFDVLLL